MKIIKLNAIDSTNTFLKEMTVNTVVKNATVVVAKNQTKGRGQMQSKWVSENGKNLMFSVFYEFKNLLINNQKYLNYAVSISVFEALSGLYLPNLTIKWPNDILSENKKICGILIENSLQKSNIKSSIIGIGVNVNQEIFPSYLANASSIKNILSKEIDINTLLDIILNKLQLNIDILNREKFQLLEERYINVLYKKNIPCMFKTAQNVLFMGKIIGVSPLGKLQIELEDGTVQEFGVKEVFFAAQY